VRNAVYKTPKKTLISNERFKKKKEGKNTIMGGWSSNLEMRFLVGDLGMTSALLAEGRVFKSRSAHQILFQIFFLK